MELASRVNNVLRRIEKKQHPTPPRRHRPAKRHRQPLRRPLRIGLLDFWRYGIHTVQLKLRLFSRSGWALSTRLAALLTMHQIKFNPHKTIRKMALPPPGRAVGF